jgi:hypothetical protein
MTTLVNALEQHGGRYGQFRGLVEVRRFFRVS